LEQLVDAPDYEWLMIDASHIKVYPHAAVAKGGNQEMSRSKGGSIQKVRLAVDAPWYVGQNRYYRSYHS
jgi:hypothetical protein